MTQHLNQSQRQRLATTAVSSFRKGVARHNFQETTLGKRRWWMGVVTLKTHHQGHRYHLDHLVARTHRRLLLVLRPSLITEISPTTVEVTHAGGCGLGKLMRLNSSAFRTALSGEHGVHALSTPSSRPLDGKMIWLKRGFLRLETDDPSELEHPGEGWVSLYRKLAAALTNIAHGEVGREITQKTTTCLNNNTIARGRVLLAIVFGTTLPDNMVR